MTPDPTLGFLRPQRLTSLSLAAALGVALAARPLLAATYYVNDGSTSGDLYCAAAGLDSNDGLSPETPAASLQSILDRYTLSPSATVYIDTGRYLLSSNIVFATRHVGSWESNIVIQGTGRTTVFDRQSSAKGDSCADVYADHIRFQGLTFTGADIGLAIDTSYCRNVAVLNNTFSGNAGAGLFVQPSTNTAYGHITIARNLFYGNKDGLVFEPELRPLANAYDIINNTLVATNGRALLLGGHAPNSNLRNNIIIATGGGTCMEVFADNGLFQSEHNNLWAHSGGTVAKLHIAGSQAILGTLPAWQRFTKLAFYAARDVYSISRDPFFASPANADFHLKSFGGRWQPEPDAPTNGVWVADEDHHSPCIDAASPWQNNDDLANEPAPNGGRKNMGCFGGTTEASLASPTRTLLAMAPDLGQKTWLAQPLYWNAAGQGWSAGDAVSLSYSLDNGASWTPVDSASTLYAVNGAFEWNRPLPTFNSPDGCWVRVACTSDAAISGTAFLENTYEPPPTVFYVNDGSLSGDVWCSATGNYSYDGLSSNTPLDSIQSVIDRYRPGGGATIYVDAGTYVLYSDLELPNSGGVSTNWFRLVGADRRTLLDRQYGFAGSSCIRVNQDFTKIEGIVCRGAETGILIDPATCRNAHIAYNTITECSGYGIGVLNDAFDNGIDTYDIRNNLLYANGGGMNLQSAPGHRRASFTVENNTVAVYNGMGIACGGRWRGTTLRNNIVTAKGQGACLSVDVTNVLAVSENNDLYPFVGASVARWMTNNTYRTALTLAAWQSASQLDASSISRDPLFVAPASGDFHLRSQGGSWHGGAWLADSATSPCLDAGKTTSAFGNEPAPNGNRINLGAYGNTREASRSTPKRTLTLLTPNGGEAWSGVLTLAWRATGSGWASNDTVRIEYAASGGAWTTLSTAQSPTGSFPWTVPNPTTATASYFLRVVCNQDPSVSDATATAGVVTRRSTTYYVNDASTAGDWYCTAIGASVNSGVAPGSPLSSLADVLKRYPLAAGDTVLVDTGAYPLSSNIVIDATHKGEPDAPARIVGTRGGTVLIRQGTGSDRRCLEVHADHIRLEGLACESAEVGISVNASSARHVSLVGNLCRNNGAFGIEVRPYGAASGEEFHLLQNIVHNNGAGLYLQGSPSTHESRSLFVVENNTLYNGGPGVKLLNANSAGRRTNLLKNNIIETTNAQSACIVTLPNSLHYSDFNNLRPQPNGYVGAWQTNATGYAVFASMTQWRSANGQDKNSVSADTLFQAPAAGNLRLTPGSPCVDAGVISFWMFDAADADGKPRIAGQTADIGAYEMNVRSSIRLFLQGPLLASNGLMSTTLYQQGLLPLTSPYADDPRTATLIPANTTDWLLLQFRHTTNGPAVLSRSVFLRADGWLVNDAGVPDLDVDLPPNSAYYVAVKHRNHVAAMSAVPVTFSGQTLSWDFTVSASSYLGGSNGCAAVTAGSATVWALRAGDIDGDGSVLPIDQSIRESQASTVYGYRRADANLDGTVTPPDAPWIQANLFTAATFPRPETVLTSTLRITPSRSTLAPGESLLLAGASAADTTADAGGGTLATATPLTWGFVQNASEATLTTNAVAGSALFCAGAQTGRTDIVEAWDSGEGLGRAYLNVIGSQAATLAGKSLIIAGRTSAEDSLWPATDYLANNAYTTLRYRGFSAENIHYLSPVLSQDTDGYATCANAADAFTTVVTNADSLFVYLVDHGGSTSGNGYFRLSGSETITAAQLDTWLDALQDTYNTRVTVLLDFCYAGSFLHALSYTGTATRIVVAACDTNQPSYFVAGGLVSFSGAFFSGVMLGYDVMQCFAMAQGAMSTYQAALLDDDKDGAYSTNDWSQATGAYIGPTFVASGDAPLIGEVCGNQVLTDDDDATLWIGSVSAPHPVSRAWCLIVPPGHDPDPDNPVTDLPQLDLAYDAESGRYAVTYTGFTAPGTYSVSFYVQDEEGNVSPPRTAYVAQIGYDDRVILVAGGDTNSPAWPAIDYLTRLAYATLRLRLFPPEHIYVLSPSGFADLDGDGSNDVAQASGLASLEAAFSEWALTQSTDRLTLYLLGEGAEGAFRLNAGESLSTNALAAWVNGFQTNSPAPVNLILDFSGAGAFLPALAAPHLAADTPSASRVAIASARAGREALFSNGGAVSFSQYLLSGVISGRTLGDAFTDARRAIRRVSGSARQQAQLDDNLNGEPNEKNIDGLVANETYLGSAFVTGADAPVIGAVSPTAVLADPGQPVTLWASELAGMYPISNVWCLVTPPGYSGGGDLAAHALAWNTSTARYEAEVTGFTQPGSYGLTFLAEDSAGQLSEPRQAELILADAYEPDDTPADASLYDGAAQAHTFHAATDADWVRVYLVTNFIYEIETYHLSADLDTVIDLYRERPDGTLEALDHIDEEGGDLGEYTGLDFPQSGWYWAQITPYAGSSNGVGTYEFSVEIPSAAGLNTLIVLGIDDVYSSALPTGATVTVEGLGTYPFNGSKTVVYAGLTNGTYAVSVPMPDHFMPREHPTLPGQVQSLTNAYYANPRHVPVSGGWRMAGFELLSTVAVTSGVVRDAWTRAFIDGAQLAFTAASGSLTGTVVDGSVILTAYRTNWVSAGGGLLPPDIALGACDWHMAVSLAGYQDAVRHWAISNTAAGAQVALGTTYLVPNDTNANDVSDAWEALYFPGGMSPAADSDGDGIDNRSEYLCGTDPTNALSALRFLCAQAGPEAASLIWSASGGRSYQVLSVTSLVALGEIQTNGPWEASHSQTSMGWADTNAPLHKARFYRVRLSAP